LSKRYLTNLFVSGFSTRKKYWHCAAVLQRRRFEGCYRRLQSKGWATHRQRTAAAATAPALPREEQCE
jgi:hypothetical protein